MGLIEISGSGAAYRKSRIFGLLILVLLLITAAAPRCRAQTWAEWFKQSKTQRKYLLNQIAALQVYIGYAQKGYEIAGSGLGVVRDITSGEFNLHQAFITGLKQVSPAVRADVRIAEIIALQIAIGKSFKGVKGSGQLSEDQLVYIAEVANGVISDCYHDLEELLMVVSSGKLDMNDEQRLSRIAGIYERMLDKSAFAQDFCGQAGLLIRQKQLEQSTVEKLRRYYEIE